MEIILIKKYNNKIKHQEYLKIESVSVNYTLNKAINPNVQTEELIIYEMILEIPKINLKKGILAKEHQDNNIDKNITILKESIYPNEEGIIYLAAHSGTGNKSYFNNLINLSLNDKVYLYYQEIQYEYILTEIKEVNKNSNLSIKTESTNNLILITCSQKNKSKYLVLILKKIKETGF